MLVHGWTSTSSVHASIPETQYAGIGTRGRWEEEEKERRRIEEEVGVEDGRQAVDSGLGGQVVCDVSVKKI